MDLRQVDADRETSGMIGASAPFATILEHVRTVAHLDCTVLIRGETGTGKELIAHAVHAQSERRGLFVKFNCAAIPATLLESELMGHERGAFTGAVARRVGRFELAQDGTLFLDEIGELPLELQPKLLRVLQAREFERLGGTQTLQSSARIIAATNRDLTAMVADGKFREDLYYRLNVFPVHVPPLRDRAEDVLLMARAFASRGARRMGKTAPAFTADVVARLLRHAWPGNVRELQNVIERSMILTKGPELELAEFDPVSPLRLPLAAPRADTNVRAAEGLDDVSRAHIIRVLQETNWVIAGPRGAAARLRINRSTLSFRMRKLGIVRPHA